MGQATDDIIEGFVCSHCGVFFEEEHGYPVLCLECYGLDEGKSGLPEAEYEELG